MNRSSLVGNILRQMAMGAVQNQMGLGGAEADVNAAKNEALNAEKAQPEPSGWNFGGMFKQGANSALPGIFNGQGGFDPMNALKQNTYGPYFGENGIFNVTQNGPWRR